MRAPSAAELETVGRHMHRGGSMNNAERKFIRDTWDRERPEDDPRVQLVTRTYPGGITQVQIGQLMGLTRQRIDQIEKRAVAKLRRKFALMNLERDDPAPPRMMRGGGVWRQMNTLNWEHAEGIGYGECGREGQNAHKRKGKAA